MKPKAEKIAELERLKQKFTENPIVVICSFEGIKVDEDFQLRKTIRGADAGYRVAPNRIIRLAAEGTPLEATMKKLRGMTSLVFAEDDPVGLMKTLIDFSKQHPVFQFRAGVVEGQELDAESLNQLSKMPGKQEIQAQLLFLLQEPAKQTLRTLNAPAQQLMGVLNAPARDLVSVLKQAVDQKKFSG